ncbi:MFS transporter [Nocardia colli]|uniref:MFS transporter n=1 Tax=Nocardia colli TaxID=2545717 RepID=A0A5N0EEA5_9NOCA|nr:MFS transporter [Nocardia colli]KAA8887777.1 MFS transporter [Nocardia colli]
MSQPVSDQSSPGYLDLLRPRGIPLLFAGAFVGRMSVGMIPVAVVLFIQQVTGSFSVAGLTMAGYAVGTVVAGPARSWISVRLGHSAALLVLSSISGSALVALVPAAHGDSSWILAALVTVSGCSAPPFGALMRVGWSRKLPPHWVSRAFGVDSVVEESTLVLGPLVATGAVALAGPDVAVLVAGSVCVLGGLLMASAAERGRLESTGAETGGGTLSMVARRIRWLLVVFAGIGFTIGATEVAVPALAIETGRASLAGGLLATLALGSAIAALLYGRRNWRTSAAARLIGLALLFGFGAALLATVPGLGLAVPLLVLVGVAMGPAVMTVYLLADALTEGAAAKTHSAILVNVACNGGSGLGAAVAGMVIADLGVGQAFLLSGIATVIATGLGFALFARDRKPHATNRTIRAARREVWAVNRPVIGEGRRHSNS